MAEPLINFSSRWLSIFYFPSFLVDFPLPIPTLNIGHGIHDDSRSGIDYHEFCELAHAAFPFINFLPLVHTTRRPCYTILVFLSSALQSSDRISWDT